MSESEREVGAAITRTVGFVRTVFSEVQLLVKDVERQLGQLGYRPQNKTFVHFDDASQNLESPHSWLKSSIGRVYVPAKGHATTSKAVILEVHLAPEHGLDEPVLVLATIEWPEPQQAAGVSSMYGEGKWVWSLAPEQVDLKACPIVRAGDEDIFHTASRITMTAWAMTRFTTSAEVHDKISRAVQSATA